MKKKGFTLIEILMSAIIMATVTTGIAYVFFASRKNLLHTHAKIQAAELSKYFLTSLSNEVRQDQWGTNCLSVPGLPNTTNCPDAYAPGYQDVDKIRFTPSYNVSNGIPGEVAGTLQGMKVKLTIQWSESGLTE